MDQTVLTDINGSLGVVSSTAQGNEERREVSANIFGNDGYKNTIGKFDLEIITVTSNQGKLFYLL